MMFDIPMVRAQGRLHDRQITAQLALTAPWELLDQALRRWTTTRLRTMLHHEGALCASCLGLTQTAPRPCPICAPVRLALWSDGVEYPLIEEDVYPYGGGLGPFRRLLLVATAPSARGLLTSRLEVETVEWVRLGPAQWQQYVGRVVAELGAEERADEIRTFIWDGVREIPFPWRSTPDPA
ncbi:hypothetical protein [Streptomyces microflavus]|uniref:hypothetical protein n=1 Tax=Streptomyces microflavus TaxID=1919 RepID=UPI0033FA51AF